MTDAVVVGGITGCIVAFINILPQLKTRKDIKEVSDKVDKLSSYIKNDKDQEEVRKKMTDIQCYYVNQMDEDLQPVAIMKSDSFITLIVDFGMGLDLEDLNDYKKFKDHLISGSKYCRIRMAQLLGEELTEKYYKTHDINTIRFDKIIQKLIFTTENSKKTRFISASVDFMQLFLTELVCLKNGKKEYLLDEEKQKARRCGDHV